MQITFGGNPVTLQGKPLQPGDAMPDFTLTANDMTPVTLADTGGVRIFVVVPSLDTPVCDLEVRTFNKKVGKLGDVKVYVVSMDLPFAQARWCGAAGVEAVQTLSDYKERGFGKATGTYVEELGLLARAVFVVDSQDKVTYAEYVPEIGNPPDYEACYQKAQEAR